MRCNSTHGAGSPPTDALSWPTDSLSWPTDALSWSTDAPSWPTDTLSCQLLPYPANLHRLYPQLYPRSGKKGVLGGELQKLVPEVDSNYRLWIVPLFHGSSRFASSILSRHSRQKVTCECNDEDITDDDDDVSQLYPRSGVFGGERFTAPEL